MLAIITEIRKIPAKNKIMLYTRPNSGMISLKRVISEFVMRILNFVVIFASGLALVLFSIENTELTTIQILPGYEVQAPLSIELILAMGIGATLAWLYNIWSRLTRQISTFGQKRELKKKEKEVETLSKDLENYKIQLEDQQKRLPQGEESADTES